MENNNKPVYSFSEGLFSKPVAGVHRIGIHIATSFVAIVVVAIENNNVCAFQVMERQSVLQIAESSSAMELLNGISLNHEWLSDQAVPTTILIPGNAMSMIPVEMFDSYGKEYLFEPQYQLQSQDIVISSPLLNNPVMAVYALPWSWNQQLKSLFPEAKILHEDIPWIDQILGIKDKTLGSHTVILNVDQHLVRILGVSDNTLKYYNRFYYESNTDILYYFQLLMEKNGLDPASVNVFLTGTALSDPALEAFFHSYSYNVSPLFLKCFNHFPSEIRKKIPALYFSLFSIIPCG